MVKLKDVRLQRLRDFGDVWLALGLWRLLGLDTLLSDTESSLKMPIEGGTSMEAYEMPTPLTVRRDGAVGELSAALRREKRSVNQVRLRGALAVARGHRVPAVAQTLGVAERAVRNWVHRYNQRGLAGLADRRTGRRPRLSGKQIEQLHERIRAGPRPDDGVCSLRGCDIRRILREDLRVPSSSLLRAFGFRNLHGQL